MVHVLVPEYALDAHRDHILHHLLLAGAQHRISAHPATKPSTAKVAVVPGVRTSTAQVDARARGSWGVPFFLSPGITGRSLRSAARPAVRLPARVFPLAFYILPFYIVGDRVRAELFDSRDCGRREGYWQTTRAARSVPTPGVYLRCPAWRLCYRQGDCHVDLAEHHVAVSGVCAVAVLHLPTIWDVTPVRGNCTLRVAASFLADLSQGGGTARMASDCCRVGLRWSCVEPLPSYRTDSGSPNAGVRSVLAIHAKLAGGGQLRGPYRLRSHCLLLVVSLSAALCATERRQKSCFRGLMDFVGPLITLCFFRYSSLWC